MNLKSKSIIILLMASNIAFSSNSNYCAGIRGNGELAPAHWSSLSRIVENKGLPTSLAGGSSAAITLFFTDAISRNEYINSLPEAQKMQAQALLFKTLVPHIMYLINVDAKAPRVMRMVGNITGLFDDGFIKALGKAVRVARDLPMFFDVLGEYGPLLNPDLAAGLRKDFSFYKKQIAEAIKVFGAFDAKTDKNIFYRKGLVDFKYLSILFGRVADLYAGYGHNQANEKLNEFLNICSSISLDKTWSELVTDEKLCESMFVSALDSYYGPITGKKKVRRIGKVTHNKKVLIERTFPNRMIFEKVGSGVDAYPTTSLVVGNAVKRYKEQLELYEKNRAQDIASFSLDFDSELRYGYWGSSDGLNDISEGLNVLFKDDLKSQKFKKIENGTWFEVLSTSPAEPGLSSLQRLPDSSRLDPLRVINKRYFYTNRILFFKYPSLTAIKWFDENKSERGVIPFRENLYSAGGWSDLHPTLVLKARGCEDIVYITRQGGESVFGQQIFIRLTGYDDKISFWKDIKEGNRNGWTNLTDVEEKSPWNRLYNLMNPSSSYNESIMTASAIYCTDWDQFNVFKGEVHKAIDDAYDAPIFVNDPDFKDDYKFGGPSDGKSPDHFPGCILKDF